MASLPMPRAFFLSFFLFSLVSFSDTGREVYMKYCSSCHHEERIGRTAPPLIPQLLKRIPADRLKAVIRNGIPASNMPAFEKLSDRELDSLINYIKSPVGEVRYGLKDIKESRRVFKGEGKELLIKDIRNLTVVVEKGNSNVWIMEGDRLLDRFSFGNVHGGVKFSPDGRHFYVPARDGKVVNYSLHKGKVSGEVRACVYLRNISVSRDGKYVLAGCILPPSIVVMDRELNPIRFIPLKGRLSAIYELNSGFVFTLRDEPEVGFIDNELSVSLKKIEVPLEDFFIDPFERYIVGSSRRVGKVLVYELDSLKKVYEEKVDALPHLFSSFFWYKKGSFFFATRHIKEKKVSVWRMYRWGLVKEVDTGGKGFFVRTHPATTYLWVDNGGNSLVLIDKDSFKVKELQVSDKGKATHVEFSGDGKVAYVSIVGSNGELLLLDTQTLKTLKRFKASNPAGKYNFVMKSRKFYPSLLGYEVFMTKCWGCHHQQRRAFGPSFSWIAEHRSRDEILSHIANPEKSARLLGYPRSAMPRINLSSEEIYSLISFIESLKPKRRARYAGH